jgi:DNA-binding GntR family transcriptional regulator
MTAVAPLARRTVAQAAADEIRQRILDGRYMDGHQLRQDRLAEELGISRIPIREAFVLLEGEGLVRIVPHRGAVVASLSAEEIDELFQLRALLEPRLLRQSVPLLGERDFAELAVILDEYDLALRLGRTARWGELNSRLHSCLYKHASQPRTASIVNTLLQGTDRYTRMQLALTDGVNRAHREHTELVDLCRSGRVEQACALLGDHILNAGTALQAFIAEHSAGK